MEEYYINTVIIKGIAYKSESPLQLQEVVELAKEFSHQGYVYHIVKKISDSKFEHQTLGELEQKLTATKRANKN